jgi:hypothetical protein
MRTLATAILLGVALVHALPALGAFSAARLEALYGVPVAGPDLAILLRHRAVLFAIVAGLLVAGAFDPALRRVAIAAGLLSMVSFVAIALATGGYGPLLQRIVVVDVVASAALLAAALFDAWGARAV